MSVETNKVRLGLNGNYSAVIDIEPNSDGEIVFKDLVTGTKKLSELIGNVGTHSIASHSDMASDFATQYFNTSRLASYLGNATNGNTVGISGDVGGHTALGDHVADAAIHQRIPKFVLRVAKGGQAYSTITAALAAIPTFGPDVPGPSQIWRVEVSPGVYNESVTIDKQWVELVGAGQHLSRVEFDNTASPSSYPVFIGASNVAVRDLGIKSTNSAVGENIALLVGTKAVTSNVSDSRITRCEISSPGTTPVWNSVNALASVYYQVGITSTSGDCLRHEGGLLSLQQCEFTPPNSSSSAVYCASGSGAIRLFQCSTATKMLNGTIGAVQVRYCFGGTLATGTGGTILWDGFGFQDGTVNGGGLSIGRFKSGEFKLYDNGDILWGPSDGGDLVQRHFTAGHSGLDDNLMGTTWGVDGPDFHFYRAAEFSSSEVAGDVFAIGDDSHGLSANATNALTLYLGEYNFDGKFLRWLDGGLGGSELGYIGRDGVINAPGFIGDGSGLTGVPVGSHTHAASAITSGTLDAARLPSNIDAAKLANGTVSNTVFQYLSGVTSAIQTQINGKQAGDATLTALAAFNTNGLLTQTALDTFVGRTLTGTSGEVIVTNGNGVSGNPTISLDSNIPRKNAANTFSSIQTCNNGLVVANAPIQTGGIVQGTRVVSSNVTLTVNDYYVHVTYISSGTRVINLPTAAAFQGQAYYFEFYNQNTGGVILEFDAGSGYNIAYAGGYSQKYTYAIVDANRWFQAVKYTSGGDWSISTGPIG